MTVTAEQIYAEVGADPNPRRLSPATRFVRSLDGDFYMISEVAALTHVSTQYLRKLMASSGLEAPSYWVWFGKIKIYLYTAADVKEVQRYLKEQKTVRPKSEMPTKRLGRPPKYTDAQRKQRKKDYMRVHYATKMAQKYQAEGDLEKSVEYSERARTLREKLDEQYG